MDAAPTAPDLAAPAPPGVTQDVPGDVTVEQIAMLDDLATIAMAVARSLGRKVEVAGQADRGDATAMAVLLGAVRRSFLLRNKLRAEMGMSDAERAVARARRDAERELAFARRVVSQARARMRARKEAVRETLADLIQADAAERAEPPAETVRRLREMDERLMDADIARAFGFEDSSAIILGLCKDLAITPRKETWSHRLMQVEISATVAALHDFQEGLKDPGGKSDLPPTQAGLGRGPGPGGSYPKIGPFNFDATGAIESVDPPGPTYADWDYPPRRRRPNNGSG